jgi:hypothetical protein
VQLRALGRAGGSARRLRLACAALGTEVQCLSRRVVQSMTAASRSTQLIRIRAVAMNRLKRHLAERMDIVDHSSRSSAVNFGNFGIAVFIDNDRVARAPDNSGSSRPWRRQPSCERG